MKRIRPVARVMACAALLLSSATLLAQTAPAPVSWHALQFLVGNWVGEGSGEGNQAGSGFCSFEPGVQDKVLVRKSHAEYPAAAGSAAIVHDDVMIIYPDVQRGELRAFYTDNEGHVIHYTVTAAADGRSAIFLGDVEPGVPRYRLTYSVTQPDHVSLLFEMAPPNAPDQFRKLIDGRLRKAPAAH